MSPGSLQWRPAGALVVGGLLALSIFSVPVRAQGREQIVIAAGARGGIYHRVAIAVAERIEADRPDFRVHVVTTGGTGDNLDVLERRAADVAVAQSDLAYFRHFESADVLALAPLFAEPLHVIVRRGLGIDRLSAVDGARRRPLRGFLGAPGSGTRAHARVALAALPPDATAVIAEVSGPADLEAAARGLAACRIDLLFATSAVPSARLEELLSPEPRKAGRCGGDLISLGPGPRSRLLADHPFFTPTKIPPASYGREGRAAATVAVRTLLVARSDLDPRRARAILDALYRLGDLARAEADDGSDARSRLAPLRGISRRADLDALAIPVHPASVHWHARHAPALPAYFRWARERWPSLAILALALVLLGITWLRSLPRIFRAGGSAVLRGGGGFVGLAIVALTPFTSWFLIARWAGLGGGRVGERLDDALAWLESVVGRPVVAPAVATISGAGILLIVWWLVPRLGRLRDRWRRALIVSGGAAVVGVALWRALPQLDFADGHVAEIRLAVIGVGGIAGIAYVAWRRFEHRDVRLLSVLTLLEVLLLAYLVHGGTPGEKTFNDVLAVAMMFSAGLLVALFLAPDLRRLTYVVHQHLVWSLLFWLVSVWLIGSSVMFLFESRENPSFETLDRSMRAILYYLFSGLEEKEPVTAPGHVTSIVLLTFGVAIVGLFTAAVIERIINTGVLRRKQWWLPKLEGHLVIVGWTDRTRRLLTELRATDAEEDPLVVIATAVPDEVRADNARIFRRTWLVEGDICDAETLENADVATAEAALILHEPKARKPDHRTIQCALAVRRAGGGRVRTIAEIERRQILGAEDESEVDEPIVTAELTDHLLVQCVLNPGISGLYEELFSFGAGSPELYMRPLPQQLEGKSFDRIQELLSYHDLTLVGYRVRRGERIDHCLAPWCFEEPRGEATPETVGCSTRSLRDGDDLIYLADEPRSLELRLRPWLRKRLRRRRRAKGGGAGAPEVDLASAVESWYEREVKPLPGETRPLRVVVCGREPEARNLVKELKARAGEIEITLVVPPPPTDDGADPSAPQAHAGDDLGPDRVDARDFTDADQIDQWLEDSDPPDRVVVLSADSPESRGLQVEETSFAIARNLARVKGRKNRKQWNLRIVVEVVRAENRKHFERISGLEVVSVANLAEKLMAQAALGEGITRVFDRLLRGSAVGGATEEERVPDPMIKRVDDHLDGRTYDDVARELMGSRRDAVLLGYRCHVARPGGPDALALVIDPPHDRRTKDGVERWRHHRLQLGDALVLLSHPPRRAPEPVAEPEDSPPSGTGSAS